MVEVDGVLDDRVAVLGHLGHVPTNVDAHGLGA
jgi:hypothetical protein